MGIAAQPHRPVAQEPGVAAGSGKWRPRRRPTMTASDAAVQIPSRAAAPAIQFARLPRWILQHPELTRSQVAVYAYLAWLASPGDECWPGLRAIARGARVHQTTALRAIARLEQVAAIQILETGKGRRSSRYRVFKSPLNAVTVPQLTFDMPVDNPPDGPRSARILHV